MGQAFAMACYSIHFCKVINCKVGINARNHSPPTSGSQMSVDHDPTVATPECGHELVQSQKFFLQERQEEPVRKHSSGQENLPFFICPTP